MEKIKRKDGFYHMDDVANKINELIDAVNEKEDRLKTLDAKVKFIMENTSPNDFIHNFEFREESLQDLWDEENDYMLDKAHNTTIPNKPTEKEGSRDICMSCHGKCKGHYEPSEKEEKIEEDYFDKRDREIREQIRDLEIQRANLDDYFINPDNKVVKGKADVKTGKLFGLDCGYIDGTRDKKIEEIIEEFDKIFKPDMHIGIDPIICKSWLRDKLKRL